jgi:hypothetical protein
MRCSGSLLHTVVTGQIDGSLLTGRFDVGVRVDVRLVEVSLPNGSTALVRAVDVDGGGATKTGFADRFDFNDVSATLEGLSDAIRASLVRAAPDKVTVGCGRRAGRAGYHRRPAVR